MVLIEFVKFFAQLIIALVLLRLAQVRTAGTAVGDALNFVNT